MSKEKLKDIFFKNSFLKIVSLLLAFISWIVVAMATKSTVPNLIVDVPINIDVQNGAIVDRGLNLIEQNIAVANVKVSGQRSVVSFVTAKDLVINASLGNVSGAGEYELKLIAENKTGKDFVIESVTPEVVKVNFDKLLTRKFPVTPKVENLNITEGYRLMNDPLVTPSEVSITGPEVEIAKIASCVVAFDLENKPLNKTTTIEQPIQLFDRDGDPVEQGELKLETATAKITITVLKNKELPLTVGFTNFPANFPIDELIPEISNESIWIAGATDQVDKLTRHNVGYVDLRQLTIDNNVFNFEVILPTGITNTDHIESVAVEFDTTGMVEKSFYVTNLQVLNAPVGYDVTLLTKQLSNVRVVGPKEIVDKLTGKDIVGEIDLSDRKISSGQIEMPVSLQLPNKGAVWAVGDEYTAVVNIKEK